MKFVKMLITSIMMLVAIGANANSLTLGVNVDANSGDVGKSLIGTYVTLQDVFVPIEIGVNFDSSDNFDSTSVGIITPFREKSNDITYMNSFGVEYYKNDDVFMYIDNKLMYAIGSDLYAVTSYKLLVDKEDKSTTNKIIFGVSKTF